MKNLKHILPLLFSITLSTSYCHNYADPKYYLIDSLDLDELGKNDHGILEYSLKRYHKSTNDTGRILSLNGICENMMHKDWKKYQYLQLALIENALKNKQTKTTLVLLRQSLAEALNNVGYINNHEGNIPKAIECYFKSLKIKEELGDENSMARAYNNIGGYL